MIIDHGLCLDSALTDSVQYQTLYLYRGVPRIFGEGGGGAERGGGGCRDPPKKLTSQTSVQLG